MRLSQVVLNQFCAQSQIAAAVFSTVYFSSFTDVRDVRLPESNYMLGTVAVIELKLSHITLGL